MHDSQSTETCLQFLVLLLCLAIRLWVGTGHKTDDGADQIAESPSEVRDEFGLTVCHNVFRKTMDMDNII